MVCGSGGRFGWLVARVGGVGPGCERSRWGWLGRAGGVLVAVALVGTVLVLSPRGVVAQSVPSVGVSAGAAGALEGDVLSFTVTAGAPVSGPEGLDVMVSVSEDGDVDVDGDGTAEVGSGVLEASQQGQRTVLLAPGESSAVFSVRTVGAAGSGDVTVTVTVVASDGGGYAVASSSVSASTVVRDDGAAVVVFWSGSERDPWPDVAPVALYEDEALALRVRAVSDGAVAPSGSFSVRLGVDPGTALFYHYEDIVRDTVYFGSGSGAPRRAVPFALTGDGARYEAVTDFRFFTVNNDVYDLPVSLDLVIAGDPEVPSGVRLGSGVLSRLPVTIINNDYAEADIIGVESGDGTLSVTWEYARGAGPFVQQTELQWRRSDATEWPADGTGLFATGTSAEITGLDNGVEYELRARPIMPDGRSAWPNFCFRLCTGTPRSNVTAPSVGVSAGTAEVTEGTALSFTVRAAAPVTAAVDVAVVVAEDGNVDTDGDGIADASSGVLHPAQEGRRVVTIPAGSGEATLSVFTAADEVWEKHATVTVTVSPPDDSAYTVDETATSASTRVRDDDVPGGEVSLSVSSVPGSFSDDGSGADVSVAEGDGALFVMARFVTDRAEEPHGVFGVRLMTYPVTAEADDDYTSIAQVVNFGSGAGAPADAVPFGLSADGLRYEATATRELAIIDDPTIEVSETFDVAVERVPGLPPEIRLGAGDASRARVTVMSDDVGLVSDLRVAPGDRTLVVSWGFFDDLDDDAEADGLSVDNYGVRWRPVGDEYPSGRGPFGREREVATPTFTIIGLDNGTQYEVEVRPIPARDDEVGSYFYPNSETGTPGVGIVARVVSGSRVVSGGRTVVRNVRITDLEREAIPAIRIGAYVTFGPSAGAVVECLAEPLGREFEFIVSVETVDYSLTIDDHRRGDCVTDPVGRLTLVYPAAAVSTNSEIANRDFLWLYPDYNGDGTRQPLTEPAVQVGEPVKIVRPINYVALGDSYSAGQNGPKDGHSDFMGSYIDETCAQWSLSYPYLVMGGRRLQLDTFGLYSLNTEQRRGEPPGFGFFACSGAITDDVDGTNGQTAALANLDGSLRAEDEDASESIPQGVDMVTLTIGGNDLPFAKVLETCLVATCGLGRQVLDFGALTDFRLDEFTVGGALDFERLSGRLGEVYGEIVAVAPSASVFVLGYPKLVPKFRQEFCTDLSILDLPVAFASHVASFIAKAIVAAGVAAGTYVFEFGVGLGRVIVDVGIDAITLVVDAVFDAARLTYDTVGFAYDRAIGAIGEARRYSRESVDALVASSATAVVYVGESFVEFHDDVSSDLGWLYAVYGRWVDDFVDSFGEYLLPFGMAQGRVGVRGDSTSDSRSDAVDWGAVLAGSAEALFVAVTLGLGQITFPEREYLRAVAVRLDETLRDAARGAGVHYVPVIEDFDGHEACSRDTTKERYTNGTEYLDTGLEASGEILPNSPRSYHPTAAGHREFATVLGRFVRGAVAQEIAAADRAGRSPRLTTAGLPRNPLPSAAASVGGEAAPEVDGNGGETAADPVAPSEGVLVVRRAVAAAAGCVAAVAPGERLVLVAEGFGADSAVSFSSVGISDSGTPLAALVIPSTIADADGALRLTWTAPDAAPGAAPRRYAVKATAEVAGGDTFTAYSLVPLVVYPGVVGCAAADAAATSLGASVRVAVLANDSAPAGGSWDRASVQVDAVASGRFAVDPADGSATFTPEAGFAGTVVTSYRVRDSWGGVARAPITVTVDGGCTITGTAGVTTIDGTEGDDVICVPDPSDPTAFHRIDAGGGDDVIIGGAGIEWVDAGAGADVVYGRAGADRLDGGAGVDTIHGGDGFDTILSADLAEMIIDDADGYELLLLSPAPPEQTAPVPGDDAAHVARGETLDVSVLDNDFDPNGNLVAASVSVIGTPTLGAAQAVASPASGVVIRYDADGSDGIDTFTYQVCDTLNACATAQVTITVGTSHCTIVGTDGDDTLRGTPGPDIICGLGGNDTIYGLGGDDIIVGGPGDDTLYGGDETLIGDTDGDDTLFGDGGDDTLYGGNGNDTLWGGPGDDTLEGNRRDDTLHGGPGADSLNGGGENDTLWGGAGDDMLLGHAADDTLHGGPGDDTLVGGNGADTLWGGPGIDDLTGGAGDDILRGGDGDDTLRGNTQNDTLHGGPGDDSLHGGGHDDALRGGPGDDSLRGNAGDDRLWGAWGDDALDGGDGSDYLGGGDGVDGCVRGEFVARCES